MKLKFKKNNQQFFDSSEVNSEEEGSAFINDVQQSPEPKVGEKRNISQANIS